jgi:hypothetical protein
MVSLETEVGGKRKGRKAAGHDSVTPEIPLPGSAVRISAVSLISAGAHMVT